MRYTEQDISKVNEDVDIVKLLKNRGLTPEKKGANYVCCCPFHNEKTPSFVVFPARNNYKCFGCGASGGPITFAMQKDNLTFPEAIKKLSEEFNINVTPSEDRTPSPDEILESKKKEAILNANQSAAVFYENCLKENNDRANFARNYINNRWGAEFAKSYGIGFAPGGTAFHDAACRQGISVEVLKGSCLVHEKNGRLLDTFYDRVVIPIRDKYGKVLGFTARVMDDSNPKYINTSDTAVFRKSNVLFGIDFAIKEARRVEKMYLVEGGPDCMKLQSLNVNNVVACLGTAWTKSHFDQIKKICGTVCFIPDCDAIKEGQDFGIGIQTVMKVGAIAISSGLKVLVKEIPSDGKKKVDADSYFNSKKMFNEVEEREFIFWFAEKLADKINNTSERANAVKRLAEIIANETDKLQRDLMVKSVAKVVKVPQAILQETVSQTIGERIRDKAKKETMNDEDLLRFFGFYIRGNCYYGLDRDQNEQRWSNFTLEPLFHIEDPKLSKRLYLIKNITGKVRMVEFSQEELVSVAKFRVRVESFGNFIWEAGERELYRLKGYLYAHTDTAIEVKRLGWQDADFFAFGNGVWNEGKWVPVDDLGVVKLGDKGNFFLPAFSSLYKNNKVLFDFERRFIHIPLADTIKLRKFVDDAIDVYGNNAKVGFCFLLAALFRDIVIRQTNGEFPILNIFGPPSSGKTKLAKLLMSFFYRSLGQPTNFVQATKAALADEMSQVINALVHFDEYKDFIEVEKREIIKGIWDGSGRTRMSMSGSNKKETTPVDAALILTGQEMPTADIAMLKRVISLSFSQTKFSPDEDAKFNKLSDEIEMGLTHLTLEILTHRKKVETNFPAAYDLTFDDFNERLKEEKIETRIKKNWITILAVYRVLESSLDFGFSYKEMLDIACDSIKVQNVNCASQDDTARFWQIVDFMHQDGKIFIDADYRIKAETKFKATGKSEMEFQTPRQIIYLSLNRVMNLYRKVGREIGDTTLPLSSLKYYLEASEEFMGKKNSVRFKNIANAHETTVISNQNGYPTSTQTSRVDLALCFDYALIKEKYGVNLEIETVPADEPDPIDIDTDNKELPY